MDWDERIELNPKILVGKPVVRGTRLSVELVIERLADGWTVEELVEQYPRLTREDVLACLRYASKCLALEMAYPIKAPQLASHG